MSEKQESKIWVLVRWIWFEISYLFSEMRNCIHAWMTPDIPVRKIVQVSAWTHAHDASDQDDKIGCFVLCDDGSLWLVRTVWKADIQSAGYLWSPVNGLPVRPNAR
jgi:hypothetical protein